MMTTFVHYLKFVYSKKIMIGAFCVVLVFSVIFLSCGLNEKQYYSDPAEYAEFGELPLSCIKPQGWLKFYLEQQRDGLTGNLEKVGYPFNTIGWAGDSIPENEGVEKWWPYEQLAYWLDGLIKTGYLLDDPVLIEKARKSFDYVLDHADEDGYLGPAAAKLNYEGDRWIHAVFFRALLAYYSGSHDKKIVNAMVKHFVNDTITKYNSRTSVNGESVMKLYEITSDPELLRLGEFIYESFRKYNVNSATSDANFIKDEMIQEHGVTYNERAKMGAIMYMHTGDPEYLKPSVAAYQKIDKYYMLVDGVNVSSEQLYEVKSNESHETCDIADYTWSVGYLLMATGNADYADKIERAIFNAAPGVVTSDFKAHQYFSSPNQAVAIQTSFIRDGGSRQCFAPNFSPQCCSGNINRIMPNFTSRLWMQSKDNGIVAAMYAPSTVTCYVGENRKRVTIDEETNYPFESNIKFVIHSKATIAFPFTFRIPGWAASVEVKMNGESLDIEKDVQTYVTINQNFKDGDVIELSFGQKLKLTKGPEHGISIERGPLVYALKMKEDWQIAKENSYCTEEYPAYNVFPESKWNYALCVNDKNLEDVVQVSTFKMTDNPWRSDAAPIQLTVPVREVRGWKLLKQTEIPSELWDVVRDPETGRVIRWVMLGHSVKKGLFYFTPSLPSYRTLRYRVGAEEKVTLIPFGCTKLRMTVFPQYE